MQPLPAPPQAHERLYAMATSMTAMILNNRGLLTSGDDAMRAAVASRLVEMAEAYQKEIRACLH